MQIIHSRSPKPHSFPFLTSPPVFCYFPSPRPPKPHSFLPPPLRAGRHRRHRLPEGSRGAEGRRRRGEKKDDAEGRLLIHTDPDARRRPPTQGGPPSKPGPHLPAAASPRDGAQGAVVLALLEACGHCRVPLPPHPTACPCTRHTRRHGLQHRRAVLPPQVPRSCRALAVRVEPAVGSPRRAGSDREPGLAVPARAVYPSYHR